VWCVLQRLAAAAGLWAPADRDLFLHTFRQSGLALQYQQLRKQLMRLQQLQHTRRQEQQRQQQRSLLAASSSAGSSPSSSLLGLGCPPDLARAERVLLISIIDSYLAHIDAASAAADAAAGVSDSAAGSPGAASSSGVAAGLVGCYAGLEPGDHSSTSGHKAQAKHSSSLGGQAGSMLHISSDWKIILDADEKVSTGCDSDSSSSSSSSSSNSSKESRSRAPSKVTLCSIQPSSSNDQAASDASYHVDQAEGKHAADPLPAQGGHDSSVVFEQHQAATQTDKQHLQGQPQEQPTPEQVDQLQSVQQQKQPGPEQGEQQGQGVQLDKEAQQGQQPCQVVPGAADSAADTSSQLQAAVEALQTAAQGTAQQDQLHHPISLCEQVSTEGPVQQQQQPVQQGVVCAPIPQAVPLCEHPTEQTSQQQQQQQQPATPPQPPTLQCSRPQSHQTSRRCSTGQVSRPGTAQQYAAAIMPAVAPAVLCQSPKQQWPPAVGSILALPGADSSMGCVDGLMGPAAVVVGRLRPASAASGLSKLSRPGSSSIETRPRPGSAATGSSSSSGSVWPRQQQQQQQQSWCKDPGLDGDGDAAWQRFRDACAQHRQGLQEWAEENAAGASPAGDGNSGGAHHVAAAAAAGHPSGLSVTMERSEGVHGASSPTADPAGLRPSNSSSSSRALPPAFTHDGCISSSSRPASAVSQGQCSAYSYGGDLLLSSSKGLVSAAPSRKSLDVSSSGGSSTRSSNGDSSGVDSTPHQPGIQGRRSCSPVPPLPLLAAGLVVSDDEARTEKLAVQKHPTAPKALGAPHGKPAGKSKGGASSVQPGKRGAAAAKPVAAPSELPKRSKQQAVGTVGKDKAKAGTAVMGSSLQHKRQVQPPQSAEQQAVVAMQLPASTLPTTAAAAAADVINPPGESVPADALPHTGSTPTGVPAADEAVAPSSQVPWVAGGPGHPEQDVQAGQQPPPDSSGACQEVRAQPEQPPPSTSQYSATSASAAVQVQDECQEQQPAPVGPEGHLLVSPTCPSHSAYLLGAIPLALCIMGWKPSTVVAVAEQTLRQTTSMPGPVLVRLDHSAMPGQPGNWPCVTSQVVCTTLCVTCRIGRALCNSRFPLKPFLVLLCRLS